MRFWEEDKMRKIKLSSAKYPDKDFIELNDFNGFFCLQFQPIGISRSIEFLTIKNRNIPVNNRPAFKKYSLTIEIFTLYSVYEQMYFTLMSFLDRNKKDGFRLYYKPYDDMEERYCLCSIEMSTKSVKLQPVVLTLTQNSLWIGEQSEARSIQQAEAKGNLFVFADTNNDGYFSANFLPDADVSDYYAIAFYNGISQKAEISIVGYNDVPLNIVIKGRVVNPQIRLYRKGGDTVIKSFEVFEEIDEGHSLQINSGILENGVWEVNDATGEKRDLTESINYANGSPYFYLENGDYVMEANDADGNACEMIVTWNEEYSD
jgi:hypothetical protein